MLNVKRFALAGGILGALWVFVFTWVFIATGHATELTHLLENIYPGYHVNALGSVVGAVWGFVEGFLKLGIIAWVYNYLEKCCK